MRTFRFFLTRIFLRRPLLALVTLLLIVLANYITFSTSRAVMSTIEGYQEANRFSSEGTYIANLDPESTVDLEHISADSLQTVYDRLAKEFEYAMFTDGHIADLTNKRGLEVPVVYMNQKYSELNGFAVSDGTGLTFRHDIDRNDTTPVLVGKGLVDDYPIGSKFSMVDPALEKDARFEVVGVLVDNTAHSNFYALDSKQYYNFAVVVPVTDSYIQNAGMAFKLNGLMDIVLTETTESDVASWASYVEQELSIKFNFFSQQENINFYNEYFFSSLMFVVLISVLLLVLIVALAIWSSLAGVRVMMREFTTNFLVGMSYGRFRRYVFLYYSLLSLLGLSAVVLMAAYSRYGAWVRNDAAFMTFGLGGGLIFMDWIAILSALLFDFLLVALIAALISWRVKRVPISVGVLQ